MYTVGWSLLSHVIACFLGRSKSPIIRPFGRLGDCFVATNALCNEWNSHDRVSKSSQLVYVQRAANYVNCKALLDLTTCILQWSKTRYYATHHSFLIELYTSS